MDDRQSLPPLERQRGDVMGTADCEALGQSPSSASGGSRISLPVELLIEIVTHAAETSPSTAQILLRVSHWTHDIAAKALHAVLAMLPIAPPLLGVYYFDRDLRNVFRRSPEVCFHTTLSEISSAPFLHSLWLDADVDFEFFHNLELKNRLMAFIERGCLSRLAVGAAALSTLLPRNAEIFRNVAHMKFTDYSTEHRYFHEAHRASRKWRELGSSVVSFPSVTHFDVGILRGFSRSASYATLILDTFENLSHLAFTFHAHQGTVSYVQDFIHALFKSQRIQLLVLVISDLSHLYFDPLDANGEDIDLERAARSLVESFKTTRVTYVVTPKDVPEWAFWTQCCREGRTIWDIALEQRSLDL